MGDEMDNERLEEIRRLIEWSVANPYTGKASDVRLSAALAVAREAPELLPEVDRLRALQGRTEGEGADRGCGPSRGGGEATASNAQPQEVTREELLQELACEDLDCVFGSRPEGACECLAAWSKIKAAVALARHLRRRARRR